MLKPQELYDFIQRQWENEILPSLCEYIKIPNKSPHFDQNWQANGFMEKAVELLANWGQKNSVKGMQLEVIRLPGRTPLIFIDIAGNTQDTVLLYGHFDKQPEMNGWDEDLGPWKPVLRDGKLYGRGGADDGYSLYAALTAIKALQEQNLPHSRCVLIIEGCEESGSYDLPFYIEHLKEKIGSPKLIICLDSGAGNYEQLWVTTSLRGNIVGELRVELITEGVHSGSSGVIPDSFRVARELLSRIENDGTGEITLAELHCDIPPSRINEAADCAQVLGKMVYEEYPFHLGVKPADMNEQQLILNRTWRPALTVTGADGLPSLMDAGNVLRPLTALKLSMRIPPLVTASKAALALEKVLTENPPYNAKISFKVSSANTGWQAPIAASWLENAIEQASQTFFKKPAISMGEGGTIPFMSMLGEKFPDAQFMITGVLGPHSNAHGPNEFLHLDMVKKITACVAYVLHQQAKSRT